MRNKRLTEEQKDKWLAVITNDFMSSEESGPDDDIYVHPLPWRSDYVTKMFNTIDNYVLKEKKSSSQKANKEENCGWFTIGETTTPKLSARMGNETRCVSWLRSNC